MYHLDKPGGPSRPRRQPDLSPAEWGELSNASDSSRVEDCPCPIPKVASESFPKETLPDASLIIAGSQTERGRSWGQTMYDVGIYGSAFGM